MSETKKSRGRPRKQVYYRLASLADLDDIIEFAYKVPKENNIDSWAPSDKERAKEVLLSGLLENKGFIFLAFINTTPKKTKNSSVSKSSRDKIVGVLIMAKGDLWWSTKEFYTNVLFYVDPVYRKRGVSENLLYLAKKFTVDLGIPLVVEVLTTKNLDKMDRWFSIKGFEKVGSRYTLRVKET